MAEQRYVPNHSVTKLRRNCLEKLPLAYLHTALHWYFPVVQDIIAKQKAAERSKQVYVVGKNLEEQLFARLSS